MKCYKKISKQIINNHQTKYVFMKTQKSWFKNEQKYFWFLFYIEDHHHLSTYQQDNFPQKQRTSGRRKEGKMEGWIREEKGNNKHQI